MQRTPATPLAVTTLALATLSAPGCSLSPERNAPPPPLVTTEPNEQIGAKLTPVQGHAARYIGSWTPWTTEFSATPPASLTRLPDRSPDAVFGEFSFGDGTRYRAPATMVGFMLDETRERFYIDSNRNGDLTDELPSSWMVERKPVGDGAKTSGQVTVREEIATSAAPDAGRWSVALFFHDRATREEFTIDFSIDRYRDYATEGHLKLGDCYYRILLDDGAVTGDFAHSTTAPRMELELSIDVNGNGLYEHRGESFSVNEPFTIAGTTYEVTRISRDGTEIELARSAKTVPEILPPPDLRPGATAPSFVTTSVDGKPISFPGDFAGKIVLLDFWAAWCGPCLREFPHLTEAYREYHQRGFEILSVSIDEEKTRAKAEAIIKEKSLTWHQSFDTGGWNGLIISRFCPGGIPAGYLVDGDTGKIIASLNQVRGPALRAAIEQGLTAQGR